ncbi:MAG: chemotaxis protein CheC [Thermoplasmata archaeon]|nr:chemotaxis protein CheC [Thermoplasmata archaeon]
MNEDTQAKEMDKCRTDALQEVGNIAAAHAATALSQMTQEDIRMDISESQIIPVEQLPSIIGHADDEVAAVLFEVKGAGNGSILLIFPYDDALWVSDMFQKREHNPKREIGEKDKAVLGEIANICCCAYLNAISKLLDTTLIPTPPGISMDMLGAILQLPASLIGESTDYALVIETKFLQNGNNSSGFILFMPGEQYQKMVFDCFGLERREDGT